MAISLRQEHRNKTSVKVDRPTKDNLTVHEFIQHHSDFVREKRLENLSARTIKDHQTVFRYLCEWIERTHWSDTNQRVQKSLFLDYKEYMLFEKNYAPCTVNIRLRPIKAYINWLLKQGLIATNYNNFIKIAKVSDDRVQPLSKAEVKRLIGAMGDETYARFRDLALTLTILDCGIRINELLSLTIHDINLKDSNILVRASISKTRTERVLPISRRTLSYLEQLREIAIEHKHERLFLSSNGERAIDQNDVFANFRRYKAEANITKKCTPYVLRHTFATEMVKIGVDIFTLQRLMGHKNITTTRQYIFLDNNDLLKKHKSSDILNHFLK